MNPDRDQTTRHPAGGRNGMRLPMLIAGAAFITLLAMTIGTALLVRTAIASQSEHRFEAFVARAFQTASAEASAALKEAEDVEELLVGSPVATLEGFRAFAEDRLNGDIGARSIQFVPRVPAQRLDDFVRRTREQGVEGYAVERVEGQMEYFPVTYVAPERHAPAALGADLSSDPVFRDAMDRARTSGEEIASAPVELPGPDGPEVSFLVFAPIYSAAMRHPDAAESGSALLGFGVASYSVRDFVEGPLASSELRERLVSVSDTGPFPGSGEAERMLHREHVAPSDGGSRKEATMDIGGRTWRFTFAGPPWFGVSTLERNSWMIVLSAGAAITVIAAGSAYSLSSSRQTARSDLKLVNTQLSVFLDSALEGILLVDADRRVVWANQAFAAALGYADARALLGRRSPDVEWHAPAATPEGRDALVARIEEIYADEGAAAAAEDVVLSEHSNVTYSRTSVPVTDESGDHRGRLWVYRDVTAERAAERARDAFVSMVSHELRTPLTSIVGFLELVLTGTSGPVTDHMARLLGMARKSSERLRRMVNDILDVSRLEGGVSVELEPVALAPLASELAEGLRADFEERDISLCVDVPEDLPDVQADHSRLFQVLTNLLTNACRYTPVGGRVELRARLDDGGRVAVSVADTGVGIPAEDQERAFERFVRLDNVRRRPSSSTGLGLAIARVLTEAQGGTIELSSEVGVGSTFTVRMGIAEMRQAAVREAA